MSNAGAQSVSIVIADDHELFRQSLAKVLESREGYRVVGEAANGREAVSLVRALKPDILILDLVMPVMPGLAALRELAPLASDVRTLLVTADVGDSDIVEALQFGARGVLLKGVTTDLLFRCLKAIMAGEYWVGRECVGEIVDRMRKRAFPDATPPRQPTFGFTTRELEIASALVAGGTNRDIAKQFDISPTTVKYHLSHMFEKAGVSNRVELALLAVEHRLDPSLYQPKTA